MRLPPISRVYYSVFIVCECCFAQISFKSGEISGINREITTSQPSLLLVSESILDEISDINFEIQLNLGLCIGSRNLDFVSILISNSYNHSLIADHTLLGQVDGRENTASDASVGHWQSLCQVIPLGLD